MPLQNGYWRYSGGHGWLTGLVVKGDSNSGSNGGSTADTPIPFGPANGDTLVSTQWIALQDPGSNGSFFKNGDVAISASTLQKGDEVYSDRDINVRSSAADWKDKPLYVLPRGTRVHIDEVKALRAGSTTQLWGAVDVDGSVKR